MSVYSTIYSLDNSIEIAEKICENEKVEKFISGAASHLVEPVVTGITGSDVAGKVVGTVAAGLSRSHSKDVAMAVTTVGASAAETILCCLMVPLVPIFLIASLFSDD